MEGLHFRWHIKPYNRLRAMACCEFYSTEQRTAGTVCHAVCTWQ
jgi:hypothetical protein